MKITDKYGQNSLELNYSFDNQIFELKYDGRLTGETFGEVEALQIAEAILALLGKSIL